MVFSSTIFLFLFLPAVCACYFLIPARFRAARNTVLLAFSLLFYYYGEGVRIWVLLLSILGNWLLALPMGDSKWRKSALILAVVFNLSILGVSKYLGFLAQTCNDLLGTALRVPEIVMPLGVSFFTFQGMSYVIDVYRGAKPQKNPANVALYISLFPQLIAGPIVRYTQVADDMEIRTETLDGVHEGLQQFVLGLAKKVLLANPLGQAATEVFALPAGAVSTPVAWLGAILFALQIFYDFSGYSDMAVGLGSIFGFRFPNNFDHPYCARSITEFWRRWHISLGSWFRDYVYIPLGGSRKGLPRQLLNLLVVWFLTGLWHGASWNFVLWGLYFAFWLVLEKCFLLRFLENKRVFSRFYCLVLVVVGWVLFSFTDLSQCFVYLRAMFLPTKAAISPGFWHVILNQNKAELALGVLFSTPLIGKLLAKRQWGTGAKLFGNLLILGLLALCAMYLVSMNFNPFLYFRF